jgi:uncharacterized protein (DUF111 family)
MTIERTGYGAGSREIDGTPNCTQVVIGLGTETGSKGLMSGAGQPLVVLEANLDDATGETLAHAMAECLDAGALDAWITPALMKKGRPAHVVSVLSDQALAGSLAEVLASETGTLGVRAHAVARYSSPRTFAEVVVDGVAVRVKVSAGRVKAENADTVRAARQLGLPVREVARRAENTWHQAMAGTPDDADTEDDPTPA